MREAPCSQSSKFLKFLKIPQNSQNSSTPNPCTRKSVSIQPRTNFAVNSSLTYRCLAVCDLGPRFRVPAVDRTTRRLPGPRQSIEPRAFPRLPGLRFLDSRDCHCRSGAIEIDFRGCDCRTANLEISNSLKFLKIPQNSRESRLPENAPPPLQSRILRNFKEF